MPIFPTYQGVSTSIATQGTPKVPTDPSADQLKRLGEQGVKTGTEFGRVMQKRQELDDEAIAMQRLSEYKTAGNETIASYNFKPELGRSARESFAKFDEQKKAELFKGLSSGASAKLSQGIAAYSSEFSVRAMQLENRVHLEDYQGQDVKAQRDFINFASTIDSDTDLKATKEYQFYEGYLRTGEKNGYFKPKEVEERLEAVLIGGVTSRVMKTANTADVADIDTMLDQYRKERVEPGSTSLKYLGQDKLNTTERILKERKEHLENAALTKKDREYRDTERMTKDLSEATWTMAEMKMRDPQKYGELTHDWIDLASTHKLITGADVGKWHERINRREMGGTDTPYDNPVLAGRLWTQAQTVTNTRQAKALQQEVMAHITANRLAAGPDTNAGKILNHIQPLVNSKEDGAPTNNQQMASVIARAKEELTIVGAMSSNDKLKGDESTVHGMMMRDQQENANLGFQLTPTEVYEKNAPRYKAVLGIPAMREQKMIQNQLGIKQTRDTKESNQIIEQERQKARDQFQAAPPGPEGEAQRQAVLARIEQLRELETLNAAIDRFGAEKTASRQSSSMGGTESSESTTKPKSTGGPVKPPKGSF